MTIDQALEILEIYAVERGLDSLAGVEHMVQNLRTLSSTDRQAVTVFMDETKELV
jgi:hypothetical protein